MKKIYETNRIREMLKPMATLILFMALLINANAQVNNYLNETFDSNPLLSATDVNGMWYTDRFTPAAFESFNLNGENVLKISTTSINGRETRPSGYNFTFYNTHGRKINQQGLNVTILKGSLYLPADWATNHRRSDMWATAFDANGGISWYPIIGFRNVNGNTPKLSCYDGNTGLWNDFGIPTVYDIWYNFEIKIIGANIVYFMNGNQVASYDANGSVSIGNVIMQVYNFNDNTLNPISQYNPISEYSAYWDNLITQSYIYNVSLNTFHATIPAAITAASAGNVINVDAGTYEFTSQMNIDKPGISIIGQGNVIFQANNASWSTVNGYKHLIGIYAGNNANPVTISNITMNCNSQCRGLNTYNNAYGILNDVSINGSKGAGLTVNGSTVIATNLNTSTNAWGAVNVDPGSGVTTPSVFTLNSGTLAENNQIWSDGANVTSSATVTVNATGYNKYNSGTTKIWSNRALTNCATITKSGETSIYSTIQAAIDAAVAGDVINVTAGTFNETVNLNKRVSLIGAGSGVNGTIIAKTGGNDGAINLIASGLDAANPVLIQDLRIQPSGVAGISVGLFYQSTNTNVSFVKIENVFVIGTSSNAPTEQERGLYVDNTSSLLNLTVIDSKFENLTYGWYFQKAVSADLSNVQYVDVTNTIFNNNIHKGIYCEKISDATFTNCTFDNNGMNATLLPTYFAPWSCGVDVNTKAGNYANIAFTNCVLTNNGIGGAKEGAAMTIKARSDGTTYGAFPATLNNVSITGCTITGNERGIRLGEPTKDNPQPLSVIISNNTVNNNRKHYTGTDGTDYGDVVNMLSAPITLNSQTILAGQNVWYVNNGESISAVITAATAGDIINVGDGTYNENLVFNKSVTLLGPNYQTSPNTGTRLAEAILKPTNSGHAMIPSINGVNVVIKGITIDMASTIEDNRFLTLSSKTNTIWEFENNIFKNAKYSVNGNWWFEGAVVNSLTLNDNLFTANEVSNGLMIAVGCPDISITNNVWENNGYTALNLNNVVGEISSNLFRDTRSVNFSDPNYYFGDYQSGILLASANNNLNIVNNTFNNVHYGIVLYQSADGIISVTDNVFEGTLLYSVRLSSSQTGGDLNDVTVSGNSFLNYAGSNAEINNVRTDGQVLNATCNWYGTSVASEVAAKISGNVTYVPFSVSEGGVCNGGPVQLIHSSVVISGHSTIQSAINAAIAGDVIEVAAGTYEETSISVNKVLTLNGPNTGLAGNNVSRTAEARIKNTSISVTAAAVIDGFEIYQTNNTADAILVQAAATIKNSVIRREGVSTGIVARGITTAVGTAGFSIQNNLFTGDLSGSVFSGHKTWNSGLWINGGSGSVTANIFENCRTAINADDYNAGVSISGNTFQVSGTFIAFGGTTPTNGQFVLGSNDFKTLVSTFINLSNVNTAFRLDITNSTYNGDAFNTLPLATLYQIEAGMYHQGLRNGLVTYVTNNLYVNSSKIIQNAINYATAGNTVNVAAGTYNEQVNVNKSITLLGAQANVTPVNGGRSGGESIILGGINAAVGVGYAYNEIDINADDVEVNGFELSSNKNFGITTNNGATGTHQNVKIKYNYVHSTNTSFVGIVLGLNVATATFNNYELSHNYISSGGSKSVAFSGGTATVYSNLIFSYNEVTNTGTGSGIFVSQASLTSPVITYNNFHDIPSGDGIHTVGISNGNISYNTMINCGGSGAWMSMQGGTFTNNTISNCQNSFTLYGNTYGAPIAANVEIAYNSFTYNDNALLSSTLGLRMPNYTTTSDVNAASLNVHNNNFINAGIGSSTGCYAIKNLLSTTLPATCNWFGTTDANTISSAIYGPVSYIPYSVSDGGACSGTPSILVKRSGVTISGYSTIQAAISATTTLAGDVIEVAPGTYNEALLIDKANLTIISTGGRDVTIIDVPIGTLTTGVKITAQNLGIITFDGFTVKNFTESGIVQPMSQATGTAFYVYNSKVIPYANYLRNGIQVTGDGSKVIDNYVVGATLTATWSGSGINIVNAKDVLVKGNTVNTSMSDIGIAVTNWSATLVENITIEENIVIGAQYEGIAITGNNTPPYKDVKNVIIRNNILKNSSAGDGIGIYYVNLIDLNVTNNEIYNNIYDGIWVSNSNASLSGSINITNNKIYDNSQFDINNGSSLTINATNNYWGGCPSVSGPVSYFPYYTNISGTPGSFVFGGSISNITASATNPSVCLGLSTTIYATGGSDFTWDNSLGLGSSKVVSPIATTTYNVTGKDANACTGAFASVNVTVTAAPTVSINAVSLGGGVTQLTASGANDYEWSTGATTNPITVSPTATTTYSVVGTTGSCTGTASAVVTVVTVSAGPNQFICNGNSATLSATVGGVSSPSYSWNTGATTQSITVSPTATTTYTVTVNGVSSSVTVFVNSKPVANAGADITIAPAGSGILTGSASNGTAPYSYSWTAPSFTSSLQNPTVTAAGTYSLVVSDAYGCVSLADNASVTVADNGYTVSGNVAYAYNLVNNQMHNVTVTLKQGSTTMYTTTTPSTGNGDYQLLGVANGTYTVHLSSPKPWGGVTSADIIAIQNHYKTPNPVLLNGIKRLAADVVDNSSSAIVILNDRTMVNSKRVNPNAVSFATGNWVFTKTAEIGSNGITYANSLGSTISITVLDGAVTQNFSALCYGDVDASYTGLKENENSILDATVGDGLSLINFPNPFSDVTTIQYNMPVEGSAVIDIFDLIGNKVASISDPEKSEGVHNLNFNASGMASGIYIYTVTVKTSDDIIIQNGKMIFSR